MAMFTSESASSLLKAEETSSASSLPRNLAIQGYGTPRWKRYEKVKFHASYHILPYLTISYHSFCTFSRIWTFLLGVAIPRDQIKSNQCHESCQLIWWFWWFPSWQLLLANWNPSAVAFGALKDGPWAGWHIWGKNSLNQRCNQNGFVLSKYIVCVYVCMREHIYRYARNMNNIYTIIIPIHAYTHIYI